MGLAIIIIIIIIIIYSLSSSLASYTFIYLATISLIRPYQLSSLFRLRIDGVSKTRASQYFLHRPSM